MIETVKNVDGPIVMEKVLKRCNGCGTSFTGRGLTRAAARDDAEAQLLKHKELRNSCRNPFTYVPLRHRHQKQIRFPL